MSWEIKGASSKETGDKETGDKETGDKETGDKETGDKETGKKGGRMEKGYRNLITWRKADELAYKIYLETKKFPKDELYGITSQLRRASISVPTNIVEGFGRQGRNELRQFIRISLGSLAETEYLLEFCHRLKYINADTYKELEFLRKETGAFLWNFFKSL